LIIQIVNIIAGLVLAAGIMHSIPGIGKDIARLARWLGRFQTIIGIIAIIVGIWYFGDSTLQGMVAIVAGLVLALGILPSIPGIGKDIARLARWLGRFQTIIGIIAIIVGIWGLL